MGYLVENDSVFSICKTWRYVLTREWDTDAKYCMFVGLNPSVADHLANDQTVRRCMQLAKSWGFGGLHVLNLFAVRSSDPNYIKIAKDPIGEDNDMYLHKYSSESDVVIAAWGRGGNYMDRADEVIKRGILGNVLFCMGKTKDGHPKHPLYLTNETELVMFNSEAEPMYQTL